MIVCDFGCGQPAIKTFKSGRRCCSNSTSSCTAMRSKNNASRRTVYDWKEIQEQYNNGLSQRDIIKKYAMSSGTMFNAVKTGKLVCRSNKDGQQLSRELGKGLLTDNGRKQLEEKARATINKRYEAGWMPKAGRCKKYSYSSPIAGTVSLDGTWELAVAQWLDKKQFNWRRNTTKFPYIHMNGTKRNYTPDFWVEELGGYLEIKGYETKLDRCKWSQFSDPLLVWRKKEVAAVKEELGN